jgi:(d)CTP diphosphatase
VPPQEALTFDLAPADIPLLNAFIAQRAADLPANSCRWRHRF